MIGVVLLFQMSCSSNDDSNDITLGGSFTIDGTTYNLTKGFIVDEGGEYDIILTSSGISPIPGQGDEFTGTGEFISIVVISSSTNSFEPGDFTYDDSGNKVPGTIEGAIAKVNANVEAETADLELKSTDGTATVSLSEDIYTITFSITSGTSSFEGSFSGMLTELQD